jgi:hypothetical protein
VNGSIKNMLALHTPERDWNGDFRKGFVTHEIEIMGHGRVRFEGYSWRAVLHEKACQTTLLPGQPVLILGRWRSTLTVLPLQCVLWENLLQQSWAILDRSTLEILKKYDGVW